MCATLASAPTSHRGTLVLAAEHESLREALDALTASPLQARCVLHAVLCCAVLCCATARGLACEATSAPQHNTLCMPPCSALSWRQTR